MSSAALFDQIGAPIQIGQKVGTGGEGAVFEVLGSSDNVAKLYHKSPTAAHGLKLQAMARLARKEITSISAWPYATLHSTKAGPVVGFLMRRIRDHKEIHNLYSPAHRKTLFPSADWKFLIHVAANCAAAFHALHESGVVIGDVNQSSVLVSGQGLVSLIDCDSYQVRNGSSLFTCDVGVALFTPPELQGVSSFKGRPRTINHDLFGLAVLIFHLLFMGRHPFAGRFSGSGEMPLERSIRECRFAYGNGAARFQMQPPTHSLPFDVLSPTLANYFERAFGQAASVNQRPSCVEWFNALKSFSASLRSCSLDSGHLQPPHRSTCPWHDLMQHGAPNFFVSVSLARMSAAAAFSVAKFRTRVEQIARPTDRYTRPSSPVGMKAVAWPAHLPQNVPAEPSYPTIITNPPSPPAPHLPAQRHQLAAYPATGMQRGCQMTTICSIAGFIPSVLGGAILGQFAGRAAIGAFALGIGVFSVAVVAGIFWIWLEWNRRRIEAELNVEYYYEQKERKREATAQLIAWQERLAIEQREARRSFDKAHETWKAIGAAARSEATRRRTVLQSQTNALTIAEQRWQHDASKVIAEFDTLKMELRSLCDAHDKVSQDQSLAYQQLAARAREMQRDDFLDQFFLTDHDIPGFGPTRTSILVSNGIETARDIERDKIMSLPGFKDKLTGQLMQWRLTIEAKFVFNASTGVPKSELQTLGLTYFQLRQPIEVKLVDGEKKLAEILKKFSTVYQVARNEIELHLTAYAQAVADVKAIPANA